LLSVKEIVSKGHCVHFDLDGFKILDDKNCTIKGEPKDTATDIGGIYKLDILTDSANVAKSPDSQMLWHRRLGHLNHYSMELLKNGLASGIMYSVNKKPDY